MGSVALEVVEIWLFIMFGVDAGIFYPVGLNFAFAVLGMVPQIAPTNSYKFPVCMQLDPSTGPENSVVSLPDSILSISGALFSGSDPGSGLLLLQRRTLGRHSSATAASRAVTLPAACRGLLLQRMGQV